MKKFLALMIAIMMLLVSVAAIAEDDTTTGETGTTEETTTKVDILKEQAATLPAYFNLTKTYTVEGVTAINPADKISFEVSKATRTKSSVNFAEGEYPEGKNYDVTIADVDVAENADSAVVKVELPSYDLPGVYSYTIKEVDTNKAGVTYLADTLYLNVTVVTGKDGLELGGVAVHKATEDGDKIDEFENTYTAGSLTIDKTVTGNMGDKTLDFNFTVEFQAPTTGKELDKVNATITVSKDSTGTETKDIVVTDWDKDGKATATFKLRDGQSVTFENIPSGVTYVVTENDPNPDGSEYQYKVNGATDVATGDVSLEKGTITNAAETASFTNDWQETPDTGIELETLPFALLMAAAFAGMMTLVVRRRKQEN